MGGRKRRRLRSLPRARLYAVGREPSSRAAAGTRRDAAGKPPTVPLARGRAACRTSRCEISRPGCGIDLGGVAKGYAVDRAVAALRDRGIEHALVGAGGDLYALGRSPAGEPWRIGIRSPDDSDGLVGTLQAENSAIATSGDYVQFFLYGGRRYHHLLDPTTGEPRRSAQRSVTVRADSCMAADAGATATFGMSHADADGLLARRGGRVEHRG